MPRINRTDVIFEVDGREWLARFNHTHNESGMVHHVGGGNILKVKHLTYCKLSYREQVGTFLQGIAPCGMKDKYDWKMGIKLALLRALEKGGFCKLHKHVCTTCYLHEIDHDAKLRGLTPKHHLWHKYRSGEIIAEPLKEQFGRILSSFYRELQIKAYWPHVKEVDGELVKDILPPVITGFSAGPEGATHRTYQGPIHGYGWSGAD